MGCITPNMDCYLLRNGSCNVLYSFLAFRGPSPITWESRSSLALIMLPRLPKVCSKAAASVLFTGLMLVRAASSYGHWDIALQWRYWQCKHAYLLVWIRLHSLHDQIWRTLLELFVRLNDFARLLSVPGQHHCQVGQQ